MRKRIWLAGNPLINVHTFCISDRYLSGQALKLNQSLFDPYIVGPTLAHLYIPRNTCAHVRSGGHGRHLATDRGAGYVATEPRMLDQNSRMINRGGRWRE